MRLGFGLYRHMLCERYYQFARQCGATDIIVHLCDYGKKEKGDSENQPIGDKMGWGIADHPGLWSLEECLKIKSELESHGLNFYGVENFDPAQWHDILLGGPKRDQQIEQAKQQIAIFAQAGIEVFGYNFSLSGVTGREVLTTRGAAPTVGLRGSQSEALNTPIPKGMVWNMVYDPSLMEENQPISTSEELWQRLDDFLKEIIPVAQQHGIAMAAHPDDPPLETVRGQPKLVTRHALYQKLIDCEPSSANQLELCVGTLAEMKDEDLYACITKYVSQNRVAYVHLRNVKGKVPHYTETFIDDGDIDIQRVLNILAQHNFKGVIIPDHAPQMDCDAPWHAGMAFAMGYLKSKLENVEGSSK
jgi:mannonate dehydratase